MDANSTDGRFAGTTAIVTGAGSGIGRATASRLAREGARVIATDVIGPRLDELAASLSDLEVVTVVGDVSVQADVDKVVAAAGGRVDALANIAGIMDGFLPTAELDDDTWERVMAVNVTGQFRMSRAVLPLMLQAGRGAIVNVSSEAGLRGSAAGTAYTTSKHAVVGLTKSTAFSYTVKGIRTKRWRRARSPPTSRPPSGRSMPPSGSDPSSSPTCRALPRPTNSRPPSAGC
jgi:NAD(P)-dependent dehydrogenase (short-subunit alcohol dehydrogenase family)